MQHPGPIWYLTPEKHDVSLTNRRALPADSSHLKTETAGCVCAPDWLLCEPSPRLLVQTLSKNLGGVEEEGSRVPAFTLAPITFSSSEAVYLGTTSLHRLVVVRVVDVKVGKIITFFFFFSFFFDNRREVRDFLVSLIWVEYLRQPDCLAAQLWETQHICISSAFF